MHVLKFFLALMIGGFSLWSSVDDEGEKINLYYPDSVAEFTQALNFLLQNHIDCGEEVKSFLLLSDFHGVISNQADPDAERVEPLGSRGGMVDWLKTLRQKYPALPIKVASAWARPQDIIKDITVAFVDDDQKNTVNFCDQIKTTPIYHDLKKIYVFHLSGDPLMDGQDLSKPLPARRGFN